jgi:outer membrane lipoprotein SlyB
MKPFTSLLFVFVLLVTLVGPASATGAAEQTLAVSAWKIPTISILSVERDKSVTIRTANYPAHDTFHVYMGRMGTRGVGGIKVATINSGKGGRFDATFDIPAKLRGQYQIAIRLQSPSSGYYSYNWFYNNTADGDGSPGTGDGVSPLPRGVIPTFKIVDVIRNKSVTIKTANFPANDTFTVRMGRMGTRGVGGIRVDKVESGKGGTLEFTFKIPDDLKDFYQIAIRLESPASGYFSYNWFYNNTTDGGDDDSGDPGTGDGEGVVPLPPGVIPTFKIVAVNEDKNVTIQTANFPANDTFVVTMGAMGTRGVGGIKVDTVHSGKGGKLEFKFKIPSDLKGSYQIAIRLQSKVSGYYSYNWFYNNTYP